ncbi:NUDIX domain-containing protein [Rubrobacter tropicus]|uniref:NUDIX domain-containing protein n=1 Tax=Rubrobacter tropicus TaxID=2653851 RepID=A0A6G8Q7C3_9ACTN|nr:NUDIX domain-containing protein [Rubrobacter tropicus]QIN82384.1 NUDIX domain-containing protein [Rubrobacter tropicus]
MEVPYTICFCRCGDLVLMLLRTRPPNMGLWNGLGGKISPGETPLQSIRREVFEEAGIDLRETERVRFGGAVRWAAGVDPTGPSTGMHAFVADLRPGSAREGARETPEGLLSWKTLDWVCDPENGAVVSNIPRFLPDLIQSDRPMEYRCEYDGEKLVGLSVGPL